MRRDYYAVLGVVSTAGPREVRHPGPFETGMSEGARPAGSFPHSGRRGG